MPEYTVRQHSACKETGFGTQRQCHAIQLKLIYLKEGTPPNVV